MSEDIRTYEITLRERGDEQVVRIDVPASHKVTYGLLHPGTKGGYGGDGHVLRIYESDTKQRAVFQNVLSFRDLSLPMQRLVKEVEVESEHRSDDDGNAKSKARTSVTAEWRDL